MQPWDKYIWMMYQQFLPVKTIFIVCVCTVNTTFARVYVVNAEHQMNVNSI